MSKYGFKRKRIIEIINNLKENDFVEKVINEHNGFSDEVLYIFGKTVDLVDASGSTKSITIYIKFNVLKEKVILISFHEAEYKFRRNE